MLVAIYGFAPKGRGPDGIAWAKQVNDKRIIDLICRLEDAQIVSEARAYSNACGAGAVAATIAAAKQNRAQMAVVLSHTSSAEITEKLWGQAAGEAVGYAGIVFG